VDRITAQLAEEYKGIEKWEKTQQGG